MNDMTLFIEYPKCTTCQKARRWLEQNGAGFQSRHIREEPPSAGELKAWCRLSGLPLKKFFNTSGLKYRELGLKDRLPGMSEDEQLALRRPNGSAGAPPPLFPEGSPNISSF